MSTFGPEIAAALPEMRALAESRMTDRCRITAEDRSGEKVWDSTKGTYVYPTATIFEGPCRIPPRDMSSSQATAAGGSWTVGEFPLDLPIAGSESISVGATVEYLSSAHDPALVGRRFGVVEVGRASQATARRLRVKENQGT